MILLAILMLPVVLKKRLAEVKLVAILLFIAIFLFITVFILQLIIDGTVENDDEDFSKYYKVDWNMSVVSGFNIMVTAYGYQLLLYPTYSSMGENRSYKAGLKAVSIGNGLSFVIYVSLGILSIYIFGSNLHASVLSNVNEEVNVYSYIVRVAFLIVLACHIPYIFFPIKESALIIIDEALNQSI